MKKMKKVFLICAAVVTPSIIFASDNMTLSDYQSSAYYQHVQEETLRWSTQGIYFDANVGYGALDVKNSGLSYSDLSGFSWNGSVGYQFNENFAFEAGYTAIDSTKILVGSTIQYRNFSGVDLLAILILPFNRQLNMFAKAGAMGAENNVQGSSPNTTTTKTRIVPDFGLGMGYYVTPSFAVNLQGIVTLASQSSTIPLTYAGYCGVSYKIKT